MKKLEFAAIAILISVFAHADTETVGDYTWTYRIVDGKAEIYNNGDVAVSPNPTGAMMIPSTLAGMPVASIGDWAFCGCVDLTGVTIPNAVTNIGVGVFSYCDSLENIVVEGGNASYKVVNGLLLTKDGMVLVLAPGALKNLVVPESVTTIGRSACEGSSLTNVVISKGVEEIEAAAFWGCYNMARVEVPDAVSSIGAGAFSSCYSLDSISVGNDNNYYKTDGGLLLTKDGKRLVAVPGAMSKVTVPEGVTEILESVFDGCYNLLDVHLPDSLVRIGDYAFELCQNLPSIEIPGSVGHIGTNAFSYCWSLTNIVFSGDAPEMECGVFEGLPDDCTAYVSRQSSGWDVEIPGMWNGVQIKYLEDSHQSQLTYTYTLFDGMATITGASNIPLVLEIPSSIDGYPVVAIGSKAFQGCASIKEIVISDSVKRIGSYAFQYCSGLERLVCGEDLAEILQWAFGSCVNLRVVKLQDGVQSIGPYAFGFCEDLRQIIIPSSVTNLQWGAFADCAALEVAVIPETIKDTMSKGCFEHIESVPKEYYVGETPQLPRSPEVFAWQCGMSSIRVSWNPVGDNVTGYRVYRSESDYFFGADLVAEITDPEVTSWMDSGVAVGQDYYYWVAAILGLIEGEESDFAIFRIDDPMSLYVDACGGCDENDGLSPDAPLATLGEAICRATPYSTVHVAPGTYIGELYIPFPVEINAAGGVATIDGCGSETCILYNDDWGFPPEEKAVIRGFVLKNGYEAARNVALERCVVAANSAAWYCYDEAFVSQDDWPLGAVLSNCTLTRCTVAGNTTIPGKHPLMVDCTVDDATIVWGNGDGADEAIDPVMVSVAKGDCRLRDASPYIINGVVTRGALDDIVTGYVISSVIIGPGALDKPLAVVNPGDNVTFSVAGGSHPLDHFETNGLDGVADGNTYTFSNVQADATLTAVFVSNIVFYVDANNGDDMSDGFSKSTAVATLQTAIDRSANGDVVVVADGVYAPIWTRNRRIVIDSENGYKAAIIDGGYTSNCALLGGPEHYTPDEPIGYGELWQGTNTVLRGFTLRNGYSRWGAGVTAGTVENCLIINNTVEATPMGLASPNGLGGGAYQSVLRNCTIIGNASWSAFADDGTDQEYGGVGGGSCSCQLFNCIEWKNVETATDGEWQGESVYENCCLEEPLFADAANGDYRLVQGSPCIVNGVVVAGCEPEIAVNRTYYVDAANGSDEADGYAKASALRSIQAALDRAISGDRIIVADGIYAPIEVYGKHIVIESESGYKTTVIDGGETSGCVSCLNFGMFYPDFFPDTNTVIRGFTLRNGRAIHGAGAVGGTLEYCLITGNVAYNEEPGYSATFYYGQGGGTYGSALRHCTVVGNTAEYWPGYYDDDPSASGGEGGGTYGGVIENCIVTDNEGRISPNVFNSDSSGVNCVGDDPVFSDSAHGDYRLMPNSPCIVNGVVVAGCESEVASAVPELTAAEVESWISSDLAARFAKSGESAADYEDRFVDKFGADPVAALNMPTDKKDAHGNDMYVWQDYVAGTDPTDTNSVFTAKIEMVDGLPVVTWEPKLSAVEEARRSYIIYGKTNLTDRAWHSPTNEASRFFKVGVEMR